MRLNGCFMNVVAAVAPQSRAGRAEGDGSQSQAAVRGQQRSCVEHRHLRNCIVGIGWLEDVS